MISRGIYDTKGELFGYLIGNVVYDLEEVQTGFLREGVIYATNGDTLASLFGLPYLGQSDPFINGVTDYGFAKYVPPVEPGDMLSGLSWLDGLLGRTRRWGTDSDILIEFCPAP